MTQKELNKILAKHKKWLLDERGGEKADLQRADLQEADLQRANLQEANLQRANLQGANLQRADLQGAYLQGSDLQEADLQRANLREAYLQGAKGIKQIYQSSLSILNHQKNPLRAFKFLDKDMTSPIQNTKIKYEVGKTYKSKINKNKLEECGEGLNVATLEWCLRESGGDLGKKYIEVEFDPKDVIVPYFSDGKFRVKKLKVIRVVPKRELKKLLEDII
jgi:hypothetical protein